MHGHHPLRTSCIIIQRITCADFQSINRSGCVSICFSFFLSNLFGFQPVFALPSTIDGLNRSTMVPHFSRFPRLFRFFFSVPIEQNEQLQDAEERCLAAMQDKSGAKRLAELRKALLGKEKKMRGLREALVKLKQVQE